MFKLWYKTSPPAVTDGTPTEARCDAAGNMMVNTTGSTTAAAAAADATANPTLLGQLAYVLGFNGTTWDRVRTGVVAKLAGTSATGILNGLVMGRYNASQPALTDGDAQLVQLDASGNLRVTEQFQPASSFTNITTATTTVVKSGAGRLARITVNTIGTTPTITVYDNTAASGTKIATATIPAAGAGDMPCSIEFGCAFATGLTVVTSAACDLTVIWD